MESGKLKYNFVESSISDIANDVAIDFREQFNKKNINFEINLLSTPPIKIDTERIKQVISNFLSNAVKFTKSSGVVKLKVEDKKNNIMISVSDTGAGISPEKQKKIFDRFYQVGDSLTREQGGFGLGLSIVESIVEAHKGKVWVESEINKGSTFYVSLPKKI
ncbi:unnamed protein product [marine sediment metagenome]|uniref:histidine kinase n=1 Tax=marine sediment metagenome TaxID=412755 RepID=X1FSS8_9ZZZZ